MWQWDWKVFAATFAALFIAEMGDKTQLAAISMTSDSRRPLPVLAGAILALAVVTAIGVIFGAGLLKLVPEEYPKRAAAILFVIIGGLMWFKLI